MPRCKGTPGCVVDSERQCKVHALTSGSTALFLCSPNYQCRHGPGAQPHGGSAGAGHVCHPCRARAGPGCAPGSAPHAAGASPVLRRVHSWLDQVSIVCADESRRRPTSFPASPARALCACCWAACSVTYTMPYLHIHYALHTLMSRHWSWTRSWLPAAPCSRAACARSAPAAWRSLMS